MRVRTDLGGSNGYTLPWLIGPIITDELPIIHLVYTYEGGSESFYVDGELFETRSDLDDNIASWDPNFQFIIGTELNNDAERRQYKGEVYLVAVYDKALTMEDVKANYDVGHLNEVTNISSLSNEERFNLAQNYPNPFNTNTYINFNLSKKSEVSLKVYDVNGREVASLINGVVMSANSHQITLNAENLSSGLYIYRLFTDNIVLSKRMILKK